MCRASSTIPEVVIFSCPSCGASHFKPDAEVAGGLELGCRRCNHKFNVDLNGVHTEEPETDAAPVSRPIEPPTGTPPPSVPSIEADDSDNLDDAFELLTDAVELSGDSVELSNEAVELSIEPVEIALVDHGVEGSKSEDDGDGRIALNDVPTPNLDHVAHPQGVATRSPPDELDGVHDSPGDRGLELLPDTQWPDQDTKLTAPRSAPIACAEPKVRQSDGWGSGSRPASDIRHSIGSQESWPDRRHSASMSASGIRSASPVNPARQAFETGKVSLRDLRGTFRRQPTAAKAGWFALVVGLLAGSSLLTYFLSPTGPSRHYLTRTVELRSGPAEGDGYSTVAELEAGIEVTAYEIGEHYTLVRDALGRAGYVQSQTLTTTAPKIAAGQKFVACRQAPIDGDLAACQARASAQLDRCQEQCRDAGCPRDCESRFSDCMAGCDTRLVVLERDAEARPPASSMPLGKAATGAPAVGSEQDESATPEAAQQTDRPHADDDGPASERQESVAEGRKNARVGKGRRARLRKRARGRAKRRGRKIRGRSKRR